MKATEALMVDHRMIRKIMEGFTLENPRFGELLKTLQRALVGHAWFEDSIFFPAFEAEPLLEKRFLAEMAQEHKDLDHWMKQLRRMQNVRSPEMESYTLQLRVVLETHFQKEEEAFFPIAERILDSEGLNALGAEMERRKTEIRDVVAKLN
jgi:hemerythrin-like domain-containing protein